MQSIAGNTTLQLSRKAPRLGVLESEDYSLREIEEIKCSLDTRYFSGLLERMLNVRYCCTKAKREQGLEKCIAWFEPQLLD
jgi:hypothetical protein